MRVELRYRASPAMPERASMLSCDDGAMYDGALHAGEGIPDVRHGELR